MESRNQDIVSCSFDGDIGFIHEHQMAHSKNWITNWMSSPCLERCVAVAEIHRHHHRHHLVFTTRNLGYVHSVFLFASNRATKFAHIKYTHLYTVYYTEYILHTRRALWWWLLWKWFSISSIAYFRLVSFCVMQTNNFKPYLSYTQHCMHKQMKWVEHAAEKERKRRRGKPK